MVGSVSGDPDGKQTANQKLSPLVEWFLADRQVELRFTPNARKRGRLAPEFDFQYWMGGRRITERALSMMIICELNRQNYNFVLSKVISALTEQAWLFYLGNQEYPEWMKQEANIVIKRPQGRPRKNPKAIHFEEDLDAVGL